MTAAAPLESNILEWHYVLRGTEGSPYEGGYYHGKLKFPPQYPLKPPSVIMITPSGRFVTNRRLCLSMSDFHPETWNPMWSVSTILTGLYSFMLDTAPTLGSVEMSGPQRRKLAAQSLEFNCRNDTFRELFPHLVEVYESRRQQLDAATASTDASASSNPGGGRGQREHRANNAVEERGAVAGKEQEPGIGIILVCICVSLGILAIILKLCS